MGITSQKWLVPTEETEGIGIDGLLQSEYYGLQTSYDKKVSSEIFPKTRIVYKID